MRIVLASSSPWRRKMLEDAGVPCEGIAPEVDERAVREDDPEALARILALAKARAVAARVPDAVVIGADQVAHLDGECFGKPLDPEDHLARLRKLRGRRHELVVGVALVHPAGERLFHEVSGITFRADLSDEELGAYVACGEGAGCAGGYAVEGRGAQLVERVDGDWFNVVGLPLLRVVTELRLLGWRPWT